MYRHPKPIRFLLVALLAMSTSAAVVCTPASANSVGSGKQAESPRTACCCGTEDGRCCGMGCCMRKQSNQVPTNPPLRSNSAKENSQALALVVTTCDSSHSTGGSFNSSAHSDVCGSLAAGTLQSQHIRIQT
jgi:hypothetical protein